MMVWTLHLRRNWLCGGAMTGDLAQQVCGCGIGSVLRIVRAIQRCICLQIWLHGVHVAGLPEMRQHG